MPAPNVTAKGTSKKAPRKSKVAAAASEMAGDAELAPRVMQVVLAIASARARRISQQMAEPRPASAAPADEEVRNGREQPRR
jgi:hypothetical protein